MIDMTVQPEPSLDPLMTTVADVARHLSRAIAACNELGSLCSHALLARQAAEAETATMRGAYDMAAESRDLWKGRALSEGWTKDLTSQAVRADIDATKDEPWNPVAAVGSQATLSEVVGQALGSASMAWEHVDQAGVFDDAWASKVYDGLMAWLSDWADEQRKQANEATAAKLAEVHQARRRDAVAEWLRRRRDEHHAPGPSWYVVDGLLDDYRDHADTGAPLDRDVAGPHEEG